MKQFSPTTEECVRRFKQGRDREENFRILFERYYAQIRRFFLRKGLSPENSSDLTQETFFSVYKGLDGFREEAQFESWLYTVALNAFFRKLEMENADKRKGEMESLDSEYGQAEDSPLPPRQIIDPRPTPVEEVLEKEKLGVLRSGLDQLPEQMRRCTQLRLAHDLSYQEIASLLRININTVKAHLHQAKKSLKEKLGPYFNEVDF
jgi:RNA polymerase sigma factor (sigma-70 family)